MRYIRTLYFADGYVHVFTDYSKKIQERAKIRTLVSAHGMVKHESIIKEV